jgi:hypothetical protein
MKSCVKEAFLLSFQHPEDSSVEGLELISQAWRDTMDGFFAWIDSDPHSGHVSTPFG